MQQGRSQLLFVGHLHDCMITFELARGKEGPENHLEIFADIISSFSFSVTGERMRSGWLGAVRYDDVEGGSGAERPLGLDCALGVR